MTRYQLLRWRLLSSVWKLGLHVRRATPANVHELALGAMLRHHGVDCVLDVGANEGQYVRELREDCGYRDRIVSFEPLSDLHRQITEAARRDPLWEIADRTCLGDREGEVEVHISEDSVASSVLPMGRDVAPEARYVGSETAPITTLDAVAERYLRDARRPFLKLDVQGYEDRILRGAARSLPRFVGLQVEFCFVELYRGQPAFSELLPEIEAWGFELHRMIPAFPDPATGRWYAADGIFFRR